MDAIISANPLEEEKYETKKWVDKIERYDGKGIINVNADVIIPDTNKWAEIL
ncbi:MAG: hypothetical protein RR389_03900 [Christensenella sp.]